MGKMTECKSLARWLCLVDEVCVYVVDYMVKTTSTCIKF